MAGVRWPPEDSELPPMRPPTAGDLVSDDDRSVAADSWSVKSEYGSTTVDDDQRQADVYSSDKDDQYANEVEASMLGLQSYWDASYAEDLANFREHGHVGEVWFGIEVMDALASWTKELCAKIYRDQSVAIDRNCKSEASNSCKELSCWSVLDIGTGNGLLLQELAKQGFVDLTGSDFSEGAISLARNLAARDGFPYINFLVDDVLETKLGKKFQLVMDKGTFDAIGLHPDGPIKRMMYWESLSKLVALSGILVITTCNNTKDELLQEVENYNERSLTSQEREAGNESAVFRYLDHVQTYPTFMFGGVEGSRVATVAFLRN